MYNYYQYEKEKIQQKVDEFIKEDTLNEKERHFKETKHNEKLVNNHNNRIKNFIFKMANHPQEIKNYINPIVSSRQELLNEEGEKILGNRGMIFKSFQTEKERIKEYLKKRESIYNLNKLNMLNIDEKFIEENMSSYRDEKIKNSLVQPFMRYKPRNDLERIFESINSNSFGRITKKDIESQIQKMIECKKMEDLKKAMLEDEEIDFEDLDYQENITQKNKNDKNVIKNQAKSQEKSMGRGQKLRILRATDYSEKLPIKMNKQEAKFYLNELHDKTHFKSAENYSLFFNPFTQKLNYTNTNFINQKIKSEHNYRNYYICPFKVFKYDSPSKNLKNVHSKYLSPSKSYLNYPDSNPYTNDIKKLDELSHFNDLDSKNDMKVNDKYHKSPFNKKRKEHINSDQSNKSSLDKQKQSKISVTLPNLTSKAVYINPQEMKKINYNPYKKREVYNVNAEDFKNLKDLAFSNEPIKPSMKLTFDKRIKGAKFIGKLKNKKADSDITNISNRNFNVASSMQSTGNLLSTNNVLLNTKENEHDEKFDIESAIKNNPMTFFQTYRKPTERKNNDEKIYIDNVEFLRTNLNDISKKVLEKCKYTSKKSKNAKGSLKFGNGKLAMTNGLTVTEFSKIYNLNP